MSVAFALIMSLAVVGTHQQPLQPVLQEQPAIVQPVGQAALAPCSLATDVSSAALPPCQLSGNTQVKESMDGVFVKGIALTKLLTTKLAVPFVFASSKLSAMAGALPPIMAKKGAIMGHIIAKPIQVSSVIGSGLVTGATGVAVGIPVGIGTGLTAAVVGLKEQFKNTDVVGGIKSKALAGGALLMKPLLLKAAGKKLLVLKIVGKKLLVKKKLLVGKALLMKPFLLKAAGKTYLVGKAVSAGHGMKGISAGIVGNNGISLPSGVKMPVVMLDDSAGSMPVGDLLSAVPPSLLTSLLGLGNSLGLNPSLDGMIPLGDNEGSGTALPMNDTPFPYTYEEIGTSTQETNATTTPSSVPLTTTATESAPTTTPNLTTTSS